MKKDQYALELTTDFDPSNDQKDIQEVILEGKQLKAVEKVFTKFLKDIAEYK